jgi:putative DNA primase/helicase
MDGVVGLEAFEGASRIAAWHLNESRRFFGELALPAELTNAARLDSWLIECCRRDRTHSVGTMRVQQYGPGGLREKSAIDSALHELDELGRARLVEEGRHKRIEVNPALLVGGEA